MSRTGTANSLSSLISNSKIESEGDDGHSDSSDEVEMPSKLIDGNAIAARIRQEIADSVISLKESNWSKKIGQEPVVPGLALIQIGDRPESEVYVRLKRKACKKVGFVDFAHILSENVPQEEVLALISSLNCDDRIHGIVVQLPLPEHIDEQDVLLAINPSKDVDGLHPVSLAKLATVQTYRSPDAAPAVPSRASSLIKPITPSYVPPSQPVMWSGPGFSIACTPLAVVELLDRNNVKLEGASVCVVGRSSLVGIPLSMLLMQRDATVTMVHSKTRDPASVCQNADVVIVAVGRPQLVTAEWIKEGAVVIDVGINSIPIRKNSRKTKLVGDVDLLSVEPICSLITPVPGGVGPMTLAMLLRNTLHAAQRFNAAVIDKYKETVVPSMSQEERQEDDGITERNNQLDGNQSAVQTEVEETNQPQTESTE